MPKGYGSRCSYECRLFAIYNAVDLLEPHLYDPTIFTDQERTVFQVANEYVEIAKEYPCPMSSVRGHLFKLFRNT